MFFTNQFRGLVKFKKIKKSEKKSYPIFYFFGNIWKHENNTKTQNYKKNNNNPSWGLTHPPTTEFFQDFWIFSTWQNPLALQGLKRGMCRSTKWDLHLFLSKMIK